MHTILRTDKDADRHLADSNHRIVAAVTRDCSGRTVAVLADHLDNPGLLLDRRDTVVPQDSGTDSTVCIH